MPQPQTSTEITVSVLTEADPLAPTGLRLIAIKVGDGPPVPLSTMAPTPRRLTNDLLLAVAAKATVRAP